MNKKFIDVTCDADIVNMTEFNKKAREAYSTIHGRTDEEKKSAVQKRVALSSLGGVAELNALEGDYFVLNVYRDSPVMDFVEMRDLPLASVAFYRTRTLNPIGFYPGSVNAMGGNINYATNDFAAQVYPFTVQTDEVEVPNISSIYDMARLEQRTSALERLALDMKIALVNVGLNTMLRASGNVVTSDPAQTIQDYFAAGGAFAGNNVAVLDPGVQATSFPSTNVIDASAAGGLTKGVFQAINDYRLLAKRRIRKIYVPSANSGYPVWRSMQDEASIVALTTGQGNQNPANAVPEDFWKNFQNQDFGGTVTLNWFGLDLDIEVQNWLPAGYCLVLTDQPAAIMWDRLSLATGQDAAGTLEVPINGYTSRRSEARQIAAISPGFCLRNFLVVKVA